MAKPVILTVDDDPDVLRSIERDLRSRFAANYRVLRASSGPEALGLLDQLEGRGEDVALIIADQRMPDMEGTEFLALAREKQADARRVLLTAYADTNAAIQAINEVKLHHYLLKPWDPPELNLYPVLDDLLADWQATFHPPFRGVRVVGQRWSPEAHRVKDFLGRHQVPFRWLNVEEARGDAALEDALRARNRLPLVAFGDGTFLDCPSSDALAERLGLRTKASTRFFDFVIVGAGPAGLAAAVYGASEGLKTLLIDREAPGGQASLSSRIENYLGFPAGLTGADLARRAVAQAIKFGCEILSPQEAVGLEIAGPYKNVRLRDGESVSAAALLIATGLTWRRLDVPNLDRLTGAGVYYGAATTEAPSCKEQHVYVVGGANSAGQAAMHFSHYAAKVTMLVRGEGLAATMSQYLIDQIAATPNIEVLSHTEVIAVDGAEQLESVTLRNKSTGETETMPASLLFIFIGAQPCTEWLRGALCLDPQGYIRTGSQLKRDGVMTARWPVPRDPYLLETSVPGIFAAGDTRSLSVKRVASGVGEGSVVVQFVHQYLASVA
jgi:thioredoxin reductase (NADPH)